MGGRLGPARGTPRAPPPPTPALPGCSAHSRTQHPGLSQPREHPLPWLPVARSSRGWTEVPARLSPERGAREGQDTDPAGCTHADMSPPTIYTRALASRAPRTPRAAHRACTPRCARRSARVPATHAVSTRAARTRTPQSRAEQAPASTLAGTASSGVAPRPAHAQQLVRLLPLPSLRPDPVEAPQGRGGPLPRTRAPGLDPPAWPPGAPTSPPAGGLRPPSLGACGPGARVSAGGRLRGAGPKTRHRRQPVGASRGAPCVPGCRDGSGGDRGRRGHGPLLCPECESFPPEGSPTHSCSSFCFGDKSPCGFWLKSPKKSQQWSNPTATYGLKQVCCFF